MAQKIKSAPPTLVRDLLGVTGASLLVYGAGLIYRPAGFILAGVLLLTGALLTARPN